jgi:methylated-DNA-[protein]-cysteine S-methyltransferase
VAAGLTPARLERVTAPTPFGPWHLLVTGDGVAATLDAGDGEALERLEVLLGMPAKPAERSLASLRRQVERYFGGSLREFDTPADLRLAPTPFARAVWRAAESIPYGEMRTYGDLAGAAGRRGAARAAGSAMRRCPIELFVPCHRVVRAGPALGAYGGDEGRRTALLRLEGAIDDRRPGRSPRSARR